MKNPNDSFPNMKYNSGIFGTSSQSNTSPFMSQILPGGNQQDRIYTHRKDTLDEILIIEDEKKEKDNLSKNLSNQKPSFTFLSQSESEKLPNKKIPFDDDEEMEDDAEGDYEYYEQVEPNQEPMIEEDEDDIHQETQSLLIK